MHAMIRQTASRPWLQGRRAWLFCLFLVGLGEIANPCPSASAGLKVEPGSGFYEKPFHVTLTTDRPGTTIRYTTDGTPPMVNKGQIYTGPIAIAKTTTLRAASVFSSQGAAETVETRTYIFVDDVIQQSADGQPPPGWPSKWGKVHTDYGMDPGIVNHPSYKNLIRDALKAVPTMSLVMKLGDLFDEKTGIYANSTERGKSWERPGSIELIYPDGKAGFQRDARVRIRGGYSRSPDNPKQAFYLRFEKPLSFPLFKGGIGIYSELDLRWEQNVSWHFTKSKEAIFIRDQFSRDTQLAMGQQGERGDFYHLYINGQYWGLYNSMERPGASFAAAYWGGKKSDYDTIKVNPQTKKIEADGGSSMAGWTSLYDLIKKGPVNDALFWKIQGRNPDGTVNPSFPNLLDVDNLIDYMLVAIFAGNFDGPLWKAEVPNNLYMIWNREKKDAGFRFIMHDAEHTLKDLHENRVGPFGIGNQNVSDSNPQWVFERLWASPKFKERFAGRVQTLVAPGGALSPEATSTRFLARAKEIELAVIAESARWGDAKSPNAPFERDKHWLPEVQAIAEKYLPQRTAIMLKQLEDKGLYPPKP